MQRKQTKIATPPVKSNAPDDKLTENQQLLAAIVSLTKAVQGSNLQSPDATQTPATAPKAQQASLQYRSRTITAGTSFRESVTGNFFFMFSNGNANQLTKFRIALNNDSPMSFPAKFKLKAPYSSITFINDDAADAAIVYFVGNGDIDYES